MNRARFGLTAVRTSEPSTVAFFAPRQPLRPMVAPAELGALGKKSIEMTAPAGRVLARPHPARRNDFADAFEAKQGAARVPVPPLLLGMVAAILTSNIA
jgi:hypothetical protein